MTSALLVPVAGPVEEIELDGTLEQLQELVGGMIQAWPVPEFIDGADRATTYFNEEAKLIQMEPNMRATDFFVPGIGMLPGDYVAGPMIVCGFDAATGENAGEIPQAVVERIRLIEREAA